MDLTLSELAWEGKYMALMERVKTHPHEAAIGVSSDNGWTALHAICCRKPPIAAVVAIFKACPEALHVKDSADETPLEIAQHNKASEEILNFLRFPQIAVTKTYEYEHFLREEDSEEEDSDDSEEDDSDSEEDHDESKYNNDEEHAVDYLTADVASKFHNFSVSSDIASGNKFDSSVDAENIAMRKEVALLQDKVSKITAYINPLLDDLSSLKQRNLNKTKNNDKLTDMLSISSCEKAKLLHKLQIFHAESEEEHRNFRLEIKEKENIVVSLSESLEKMTKEMEEERRKFKLACEEKRKHKSTLSKAVEILRKQISDERSII